MKFTAEFKCFEDAVMEDGVFELAVANNAERGQVTAER